jgi:hypothetical protein
MILDDPELRNAMGLEGRRVAENFFSLETFVARMSQVLIGGAADETGLKVRPALESTA